MQPGEIRARLSDNLKSQRAKQRINQKPLAEQMRALGYGWVQQTVSDIERRQRALLADEIFGLSLIFGTSVADLVKVDRPVRLDYGGKKPIPPDVTKAWFSGQVAIELIWDSKQKRHTGFSVEGPAALNVLGDALDAFDVKGLRKSLDAVIERLGPKPATRGKEKK